MAYLVFKALLSGAIVVGVSEIAKRSSLFAGILASLPLTSLLALIWLYIDTGRTEATTALSNSIFWMVLPSLFFFFAFPLLVKLGLRFYPALIAASVAMSLVYWGYVFLLRKLGVTV